MFGGDYILARQCSRTNAMKFRITAEEVGLRGLLGRSVVTVLDWTDGSSGLSLSPVCVVLGSNWEISSRVFAALSSPRRH